MVVVDNDRRKISKTVEVSVTSVLQTTAGKMIFGRYDGKSQSAAVNNQPITVSKGSHPPQKVGQTAGR